MTVILDYSMCNTAAILNMMCCLGSETEIERYTMASSVDYSELKDIYSLLKKILTFAEIITGRGMKNYA